MAGCVSCFVLPLLLFIFHRYIQPIILKFWNPWDKVKDKPKAKDEDAPLQPETQQKRSLDVMSCTESNGDCCVRG